MKMLKLVFFFWNFEKKCQKSWNVWIFFFEKIVIFWKIPDFLKNLRFLQTLVVAFLAARATIDQALRRCAACTTFCDSNFDNTFYWFCVFVDYSYDFICENRVAGKALLYDSVYCVNGAQIFFVVTIKWRSMIN